MLMYGLVVMALVAVIAGSLSREWQYDKGFSDGLALGGLLALALLALLVFLSSHIAIV